MIKVNCEPKVDTAKAAEILKEINFYDTKGLYDNSRDRLVVLFYKRFPRLFIWLYKFYDKVRIKKLDPD